MSDEKTCRNCVMYQDGYCNRDGMHADTTKAEDSCRWWIGGMRNDKKDTQMVAAAKVIKKCCEGYGSNCEGCPFDAVGPCCPLNVPSTWEILEVPKNEKR